MPPPIRAIALLADDATVVLHGEVSMVKSKPQSLVHGVLLRDVAALKRRVQAVERALWPSAGAPRRRTPAKRRLIEVDEGTARQAAIKAFHREEHEEWVRKNPHVLEGRRAARARLNMYLRDRGFEPEPEGGE